MSPHLIAHLSCPIPPFTVAPPQSVDLADLDRLLIPPPRPSQIADFPVGTINSSMFSVGLPLVYEVGKPVDYGSSLT